MPRTIVTVYNSLSLLHPSCKDKFIELADTLEKAHAAGATRTLFRPHETYRTPMRQDDLYKLVGGQTKAPAWKSAHQYGMAVDYVPWTPGLEFNWNEDNDWDFLGSEARKVGLERPIAWDLAHVEYPFWRHFL